MHTSERMFQTCNLSKQRRVKKFYLARKTHIAARWRFTGNLKNAMVFLNILNPSYFKSCFREALTPPSREEPLALLIPLFLLLGVQLVLTLQIVPLPIPLVLQRDRKPPLAPLIHSHPIPLALQRVQNLLSAPPIPHVLC